MTAHSISQEMLNTLMPAERSNEFFEALYGDAEEGAYDISLVARDIQEDSATLAFELRQRPGKCLVCSVTYGLPQVFQRHPLINTNKITQEVSKALGWEKCSWELGRTEEHSAELHSITLFLKK